MDGWVSKYIGIPFQEHGRDRSGCDCYGLVRLVLSEEFGRDLPPLLDGYDDFADRAVEGRLISEGLATLTLPRVGLPVSGDIVHLSYFGQPSHVGVYVGEHRMLHVTEKQGYSCIEDLRDPRFASRVKGYYHVD